MYPLNKDRAKEVIETALAAAENREGFFEDGISRPEEPFVDLIKEQGKKRSDDAFPVNALFLSTTMVFGSRTDRYFRNITDPVAFGEYNWVFDPRKVLEVEEGDLIEHLEIYTKPGGYQRRSIKQWMHNCQILVEKYDGDVRNFFLANENDALKAWWKLVVKPRARNKTEFQRYGPKLSSLLMQWLRQYDLYEMDNLDVAGIPVDFQLGRVAIQTGMVGSENGRIPAHDLTYKILPPFLMSLCDENGWDPRHVSEALWNIGSIGCNDRAHDVCPVANHCDRLISRTPYDKGGMFSLDDVGRYE